MKNYRFILFVSQLCFMGLYHPVNSQSPSPTTWPQFRGENCTGIAQASQNPPIHLDPENALWKIPVIAGFSSPCIWEDKIFLTGFDNERQLLHVLCISRTDGRQLWDQIVPVKEIEKVHKISNPATATPVTDGERVYVYFGSYGLLCYDFSGKLRWSVPLPVVKTMNNQGSGTSPVIAGDLIILSRDEENDPYLLAVNRHTGDTVWKQPQPQVTKWKATSYSTPVIWNNHVIVHRLGEIVAYRLEDGKRDWAIKAPTNGTSTPVVNSEFVFVGAWSNLGEPDLRPTFPEFKELLKKYDKNQDNKISRDEFPQDLLFALRPESVVGQSNTIRMKGFQKYIDQNADNAIDNEEWKEAIGHIIPWPGEDHGLVAIKSNNNGDDTSIRVLWAESKHVPEVPSPIYYDGRVYMIKNGGIVTCMNAETGQNMYSRQRLGATGPYYFSPVIANDRIYIASAKGVVVVFATGDKLTVLARNDLKEKILATPAIVDNKLYVRTEGHLYAFGD